MFFTIRNKFRSQYFSRKLGYLALLGIVLIAIIFVAYYFANVLRVSAEIDTRNVEPGNIERVYTGHNETVKSIFLSRNYLFSGSADKTIKQWNIDTGNLVRNYPPLGDTGHTTQVNSVFVSPDGSSGSSSGRMSHLFSGSDDGTIKQWNIETGTLVRTYTGHTNWVHSVFAASN